MEKKGIAVIGDLTALFFAKEQRKGRIDYRLLNDKLLETFGVEEFDLVQFFTLYHKSNAKQTKFLDFLQKELKWDIERIQPSEVRRTESEPEPPVYYRFDAKIAYELGSLLENEDFDKIVVISDSYDLASPMIDLAKFEIDVYLAFFGRQLDFRWNKLFREESSNVKLLNLDELLSERRTPTQPRKSFPPREDFNRFEEDI